MGSASHANTTAVLPILRAKTATWQKNHCLLQQEFPDLEIVYGFSGFYVLLAQHQPATHTQYIADSIAAGHESGCIRNALHDCVVQVVDEKSGTPSAMVVGAHDVAPSQDGAPTSTTMIHQRIILGYFDA
jgi:hypothetical protein